MYKKLLEKVYNYCITANYNLDERQVSRNFGELDIFKNNEKNLKISQRELDLCRTKSQLYYIQILSEKFGDKLIFMKGILLAQDLYGNTEQRKSRDIDILVKQEHVQEIGNYLEKRGFECEIDKKNWCATIKKSHLKFIKKIQYNVPLIIEVHEEPLYSISCSKDFIKQIWARAVYQPVFDINPLVMDLYDRVVYYILHFFKHTIVYEVHALLGKSGTLKIKNILDIYIVVRQIG